MVYEDAWIVPTLILAVAFALAGFAWWHYRRKRPAEDVTGGDHA